MIDWCIRTLTHTLAKMRWHWIGADEIGRPAIDDGAPYLF